MSGWSGETGSGRDGHLSEETLSAYLDGAIPGADERERIRRHLEECDACRQRLEELRTVVELLAGLPQPLLPRSFHLTPEMLQQRQPTPPPPLPVPWIIRAQPALRRLTALAAVLLVVLVTSDLLVHNRAEPSTELTTSSAPAVSKQSQTSDTTSGASNSGAVAPRAALPSSAQATPQTGAPAATGSYPAAVTSSSTPATAAPSPTPSPTPTRAPAAPPTGPRPTSPRAVSPWRVAEIAVGIALLALFVVTLAVPRLRARSSRR